MTPAEYKCLQSVETLLRENRRVTQTSVAELSGKAQTQISRWFRRFEKLGILGPHPLYLRTFTPEGWATYQRGPDEPERRPGQKPPSNEPPPFTRPMFETLYIFATHSETPMAVRLKANPHLSFVRLNNVLESLRKRGYAEIVEVGSSRVWAASTKGVEYLQRFRDDNHPWYSEATQGYQRQESA